MTERTIEPVARSPWAGAAPPALAPNLFIIGASKAGTSALHHYLRPHPQIRMSDEKEPCFFVDQDELEAAWPIMARNRASHDTDAYLALFEGGEDALYRGEASVYYAQAPHRSGVPGRIAAAAPEARIVYLVREPVERAIGHYWQRAKEFQEPLPLDRAIRENPLYRDTSNYAMQMAGYLEHFDRDHVHVVVAEELRADRRRTLAVLLEWLEVEPYDYSEAELADVHTSPPTSRAPRAGFVKAIRDSAMWQAARRRLPRGVVDGLRTASTRRFERASVDDSSAREYLRAHLAGPTAEFERMIGRDIPAWARAR